LMNAGRHLRISLPAALALCFLWNGCSLFPHRRGPDLSELGPYDVISAVERNFSGINGLSDRAMIYIASGELRHRGEAILLYKRPDLMKAEINGPIGVGLITAVIRDDFVSAHLQGHGEIVEFEGDEAISGFIGVSLSPRELIPFLLGLPDFGVEDADSVVDFRLDDGDFILTIAGDKLTRRVLIDGRRLVIRREEILTGDGKPALARELARYIRSDGVMLPNSVRIRSEKGSVRIDFLGRRINPGLSRSDFTVSFDGGE